MKEYANRTSVGSRRLNKTVEQKMEEVLMATLTFEGFALRFGQYHLVNNTAHLSMNSQNIGEYLVSIISSWHYGGHVVYKKNEISAMLVQQDNPLGIKLSSQVENFNFFVRRYLHSYWLPEWIECDF